MDIVSMKLRNMIDKGKIRAFLVSRLNIGGAIRVYF